MAKPSFNVVAVERYDFAGPRAKLDWVFSRSGKVNAIARIDVAGREAFKRAGLVAFAAPSDDVRLFVFLPDGKPLGSPTWGNMAWRYEAWFVAGEYPADDKRLVRPLVTRRECITSDIVEVFAAAELAARNQLYEWMGKLG